MIKAILWDFDGVILDSMKVKGDGFVELFKEYDREYTLLLEKYHYENGGVSRFEKIKYFYNTILEKEVSENEINVLANKFSSIIEAGLFKKKNIIQETVDYIIDDYKKYNFHIVSGAEHNELNTLCDFFSITKYFLSIEGSPIKKKSLIKNILEKFNYKNEETILIGDSINDYNAALSNNIKFYGYNNNELKKFAYIETFKDFKL